MTIILDLRPEVERGLLTRAQAKGISLTEYVNEIVVREAQVPSAEPAPAPRTGRALIDVCAEIRGLLTDEEVDSLFARNRSSSRPVDL